MKITFFIILILSTHFLCYAHDTSSVESYREPKTLMDKICRNDANQIKKIIAENKSNLDVHKYSRILSQIEYNAEIGDVYKFDNYINAYKLINQPIAEKDKKFVLTKIIHPIVFYSDIKEPNDEIIQSILDNYFKKFESYNISFLEIVKISENKLWSKAIRSYLEKHKIKNKTYQKYLKTYANFKKGPRQLIIDKSLNDKIVKLIKIIENKEYENFIDNFLSEKNMNQLPKGVSKKSLVENLKNGFALLLLNNLKLIQNRKAWKEGDMVIYLSPRFRKVKFIKEKKEWRIYIDK